jgi:hypothetical protein
MRVIDLNGKERKVKSLTKILHDVSDTEGGIVKEPYVEVVIEGKQSTWKEWWALSDFSIKNPDIILEG